MKLTDVISRVRDIAGDRDALQFSDPQVVNWINDGVVECALANDLLQKRASSFTDEGQSDYLMPTDILKLHTVRYDGVKLKALSLEEVDKYFPESVEGTEEGKPSYYYIWAGNLTLKPVPNEVKTLVLDYIFVPPVLSGDNLDVELPLPVGYHGRIVDYCLAQVAQQDDDIERYNAKMEEFHTGVRQMRDKAENNDDVYPFITVSERDTDWWGEY